MLKDDREKGKNVNEQARLVMLKVSSINSIYPLVSDSRTL